MSGFRSLLSRLFGRRTAPPEPPAAAPSVAAAPVPQAAAPSVAAAPVPQAPPAPRMEEKIGTGSPSPVSAPPKTEPPEVARRVERVAERILGNERLTADLDDQAAQVLLDWALARAQAIAGSAAGPDEDTVQAAMEPRLVALERMARLVSRWAASGRDDLLASIVDQVALVYDRPPQAPQVAAASTGSPVERIRLLRAAIEEQGT